MVRLIMPPGQGDLTGEVVAEATTGKLHEMIKDQRNLRGDSIERIPPRSAEVKKALLLCPCLFQLG